MALYNLMVHFQGRQRCFNLMGYIRNNFLQKFFGLPLVFGMSREDRRHLIDCMKKAVPVTSLRTFDAGCGVAIQKLADGIFSVTES